MRRIHAPDLWARLPLAGETPVVAVIDTGVMDDHPDLEGQVIASKAFSYCPSSGGPNGTDGYPVYSRAMMFSGAGRFHGCGDIDPMYESHGTQVAGIIAAKFGGGRMVGVDPDIRVASYKVFDHARRTINGEVVDRLNVYETSIFRALMDVAQSGYRVVNLSLGGPAEMSDRSDRASWLAWNRVAGYLDRRGVLLVASAGNEAWNLNGTTGEAPGDLPTVIDVSASAWTKLLLDGDGLYVPAPGSTDWLAPYSNFGAAIDLTAPGGDCREDPSGVLNCLGQYAIYTDLILPDGSVAHGWGTGTSMAAPHVSAIAAAVRALHPDWDPGTVRSYLKDTAEKIGDRQSFGHGMISADQVQ